MTVDPNLCRAIAVDLLIGRPLTAERIPQLLAQLAAVAELADQHADAKAAILLQAARLAALESEIATLQASVVAAMSDAGPEVAEDERCA